MHVPNVLGSRRTLQFFCSLSTLLVALVLLSSCSTTQPVRVPKAGESTVTLSLGGPVVPGESPVGFIPYLNLGYIHGISNDLCVQGDLHALPAVFGTLGADIGVATRLCSEQGWQPELTAKGQILVFTDFQDVRFYPLLSVVGSYKLSERVLGYGGAELLYQFHGSQGYFTPLLGTQFPLSKALYMQVECKWMASNKYTGSGVFEGVGAISSHGSIGLFLGVNYAL